MPARRVAARKLADRPNSRSLATRRRILEVAEQPLSTHGYGPSTMADVAERAGVSVGTVYYHFPDKRSLLLALIEHWGDREIQGSRDELLGAFAREGVELRSAIAEYLEKRLSELRRSGGLRLVFLELAERDPEVAARLGRIDQVSMERVRDLIALGQARGALRSTIDPLAAAFLVVRAIRSAAIEILVHRAAKPEGAAVQRELVDLIYHYLVGR
jgi:AcrR family transcriptional regulator